MIITVNTHMGVHLCQMTDLGLISPPLTCTIHNRIKQTPCHHRFPIVIIMIVGVDDRMGWTDMGITYQLLPRLHILMSRSGSHYQFDW